MRYTLNKSITLSKNTTTKNTEGDNYHQQVKKCYNIVVVDENESESSDSSDTSYIPPTKIRKAIIRENDILTEEVCAALDRTKNNYRNAFYIVAPMYQSMDQNINKKACSVLTIRRRRMEVREKVAEEIKQSFKPEVTLTIHWDGKLLPALTSKKKVDRLTILVSGEGISKLLGVPAIASGTGKDQAFVFILIIDWNIIDRVTCMCFDTTVSNTSKDLGACTILEERLGKQLFDFACRHHVHELLRGAAFDSLFEPSSGPNIKLFQRFREIWDTIDQDIHVSAMEDFKISALLMPLRNELIIFIKQQLFLFQPRDDYEELLLLSLIFLGEN